MYEKTNAITLKSLNFKDRSKIITTLTDTIGIQAFIVHGISTKKSHLLSITSLFCLSEINYQKRKSEIYSFKDGSIIDDHFFLRKDLNYIRAASSMVDVVVKTQFPQKKASNIFSLLTKYIKNIPINPIAMAMSFNLKLLSYEGLLKINTACSQCRSIASSISQGESLCSKHANNFSIEFSDEEYKILRVLTYVRQFSFLKMIEIPSSLKEKISLLIENLI